MALFGNEFYKHSLIRKYTIVFGNIFNDLTVERFDSNGNRIQTFDVPIAYGPKEKFLQRLNSDPDLDRQVAMQLPRMSFEIVALTYDSIRKTNSTQKRKNQLTTDENKFTGIFSPVPYDIAFQLNIMVKTIDDGLTILEQILPFFTPEWTVSMNLVPSANIKKDIPIVLDNVTVDDSYEGDFDSRRAIIWTLDFTMKAYLYGPTSKSGYIKTVIVDNHVVTGNTISTQESRVSRLTVTPGLTSANTPTTNADLSIAVSEIKSTDNFGIVSNTQFFLDGASRNNVLGVDE